MSEAQPTLVAMSSTEYKQAQIVKSMEEAAAKEADETVRGGRYGVPGQSGVFMDANGNVISDGKGSKPTPSTEPVSGQPSPPDPGAAGQITMTHEQLDAAAASADPPVDLTGTATKADKAERLRAAGVEIS